MGCVERLAISSPPKKKSYILRACSSERGLVLQATKRFPEARHLSLVRPLEVNEIARLLPRCPTHIMQALDEDLLRLPIQSHRLLLLLLALLQKCMDFLFCLGKNFLLSF
eukprot:gnl/Trimastix_PCT/1616.p1 GENE.gnl/Trimastix_PCT/1616~~gnl/Trimastix_PCT/1616.p1  ORF type:complete len:110 (+),score=12.09 gnl/Trimastix_PCT/1616:96-425(+)